MIAVCLEPQLTLNTITSSSSAEYGKSITTGIVCTFTYSRSTSVLGSGAEGVASSDGVMTLHLSPSSDGVKRHFASTEESCSRNILNKTFQ